MTEHKKREKVISGLECCLAVTKCGICPYNDSGDVWCGNNNQLLEDALELLRAQEPRVMTLEEYDAWTDLPFTKRNPVFHEERTERGTVTCWVNTTVCSLNEYGKNDRCWTSRPSDEVREATPWN